MFVVIRTLLLAIASFGYLANGTQAHVHVASGETIEVMMCSSGMSHVITLDIPTDPTEETEHSVCGECVTAFALEVRSPVLRHAGAFFVRPVMPDTVLAVFPRSPLWPGAPPQGPPISLKA